MSVVRVKQKNKNALRDIAKSYDKDYFIKVGFPASKTGGVRYPSVRPEYATEGEKDPPTVVSVAYRNEFGVGVPKRDFMKQSRRGAEDVMKEKIRKLSPRIARGGTTKGKIVDILAPFVTDVFKETIVRLSTPANSERTIEIKGSSNPLVDSGLMGQVLTYEVLEDKGEK